jgi:hypothetical protein
MSYQDPYLNAVWEQNRINRESQTIERSKEPTFTDEDFENAGLDTCTVPNENANAESRKSSNGRLQITPERKETLQRMSLDQLGGKDKYAEHVSDARLATELMKRSPEVYRLVKARAIREGKSKLAH